MKSKISNKYYNRVQKKHANCAQCAFDGGEGSFVNCLHPKHVNNNYITIGCKKGDISYIFVERKLYTKLKTL